MPEINDGGDLYAALEPLHLLEKKPPMWWPSYGSFEVLVGAILTQNTQWTKVERSLENLRANNFMTLETVADLDLDILMELIQPSGLYKSKAKYLKTLCRNIVETYGDYESFCFETDRTWLLSQKGIGPETADSILCYGCRRPAMAVDAYTARLVAALGYEFESYDELQGWCENGLYGNDGELAETYALLHGMIVEYVKRYKQGKSVSVERLYNGVEAEDSRSAL